MSEHIPNAESYIKRLNWYLQEHYPANKKITAEEWNALFLALMNQGNAQEETLEKICNIIIPQHIRKINELIDITVDLDNRINSLDTSALRVDNFYEGEYVNLLKVDNDITISFDASAAIYDKLDVGDTLTGSPGSPASVTKTITDGHTKLNFVIPGGVKGDKGDQGIQGPQGVPGYGWIAMEVEEGNLVVHTKEIDPTDFVIGPDGYMRINI